MVGFLAVACLVIGGLTSLAFATAAPVHAATIPPTECSIASNGSFETPNIQDPANPTASDAYISGYNMFRTSQATMSGWSTVAGTVDILRYYNNASDGDQSIDLWGTAPATMQQTFTGLVPGTQYTFSIDYSGLQAGASRGSVLLDQGAGFTSLASLTPPVDAVSNGTNDVPQTRAYTVTWSTYTHTFTAIGTSATIRLQNQVAPAVQNTGLFIDNFTFSGGGPCQDLGDAPDSYGTTLASNGARNVVSGYDAATKTAPVMLGSTVDTEADGQPNAAADGDGADEDGVATPLVIATGAASSVSVSATNNTSQEVTLAGWVDLNGDGQFQSAERATATVPANSGTASYTLGFPAGTVTSNTYARFRVYGAVVADPQPTGNAVGGEVEDYPVTVVNPQLTLVKHAAPTDVNGNGLTDAGDTIQYSFTLSNTGDVAITNPGVTDPKAGAVTCAPGTLAPGASITCTAATLYTVTAADVTAGGVDNSATASGTAQGTTTTVTSSPSTTHTTTTAPAPGLSIAKSVSPSDPASFTVGRVVTYTFVVRNTGNVPVAAVSIDDSNFSGTGTLSALDCPPGADSIPVGGQVTCTSTYTLTQADIDAGQVSNTATATGTPPGSPSVTSPPSRALIPLPPAPGQSFSKTADSSALGSPAKVGDVITYHFTSTNTGNVTLTNVAITDTMAGLSPLVYTWPGTAGTLLPGQSVTATATYAITQADIDAGHVANTASASSTDPSGNTTTAPPSGTDTAIPPAAGQSFSKTADSSAVGTPAKAGDVITYHFTSTNTGNLTLTNVGITDTMAGLSPLVYTWPGTAGTLLPGQTVTATATYAITQADVDAGHVANTATATSTDAQGIQRRTAPGTASVELHPTPVPTPSPSQSTPAAAPAPGGPTDLAYTGASLIGIPLALALLIGGSLFLILGKRRRTSH
jgi:uncharacterized repeat protein (TIGR01451 family)